MLEPDYFAKRRAELGFDRVDQLDAIQKWCDERYPGRVRVKRLHQGILRVVTTSSGVASELRMRQRELLEAYDLGETRLAISIGTLESDN
jgi:hypothetical protein